MIVRQSGPAQRGRTAAPAARLQGETSEARFFVSAGFGTGNTERSEMTHARFDRPDRTTPHAGLISGAQRETCIHRLGGEVRLSGTSAALRLRHVERVETGFVGLDTIGKSNERGRTAM
jgi:hypothetical protein